MAPNNEMEVVKGLDLEMYMGRWYEIAWFPSRFQPKDGKDTRATYTLNPDGTVHILNETFTGGKRGFIEGTAFKADPSSDKAKLKVKFYVPPFLPIFSVVGDYWLLFIDPDYQYALVGQPSRKYLWILCRKPFMEEEVYNELVERARKEGYDVSKLRKTPQRIRRRRETAWRRIQRGCGGSSPYLGSRVCLLVYDDLGFAVNYCVKRQWRETR